MKTKVVEDIAEYGEALRDNLQMYWVATGYLVSIGNTVADILEGIESNMIEVEIPVPLITIMGKARSMSKYPSIAIRENFGENENWEGWTAIAQIPLHEADEMMRRPHD